MTDADQLVARYILRQYREDYRNKAKHLSTCTDVVVEHPEAEDGFYGCDTGCEYYTLDATIRCPHGEMEEYHYGDFGEISYILEDMEKETR